jgi:hypothetical protein
VASRSVPRSSFPFFCANFLLQSAAEKASSGLQEKLDQNALPIRAYLEQVHIKIPILMSLLRHHVVPLLNIFQAVVPILLQGMSALVKERFASLSFSFPFCSLFCCAILRPWQLSYQNAMLT